MKEFWNNRYSEENYVYGENPNEFLKDFVDKHKPGKILFPAEGEGRNAVYAAIKAWQCDAFDYSEVAKQKALKLADNFGVQINYQICDYENFEPSADNYDVIAMIFAHLHVNLREGFFGKVKDSIKTGGHFVTQVFSKNQLNKQLTEKSGGPQDINLLYSVDEFKALFSDFEILRLEEKEIFLSEGSYHIGQASVVEAILRKK